MPWVVRTVLLLILAAACEAEFSERSEPTRSCDPSYARFACDRGLDPNACRWAWLHERRGDAGAMSAVVDSPASDLDAVLRALFPYLEGKELVGTGLAAPEAHVFEFKDFPAYPVEFPVDWESDPYGNSSWRFYFQNLDWLGELCGDEDSIDTAAHVMVDWAERALYETPPLEWTWGDHALAIRLKRVASCFERYVQSRAEVDRRVAHAAARVLLSHLYALGTDSCYNAEHNHGMMQDLAVLDQVRRYPSLRDGASLWELARARLDEQIEYAVTADGVHVENSPHYQVVFIGLLNRAITTLERWGDPSSVELAVERRDALFSSLTHLLQPNLTLPQFGDTENKGRKRVLMDFIASAREPSVGDSATYDQLAWVLTRGASGVRPEHLDRVFEAGGYAAFRSAWEDEAPRSAITAHFKCTRKSRIHYHKDETSFEIYGYGQELIVDPGLYSYDYEDPLVQYQYDAQAHNVLVVDRASYEPTGTPQILDYGLDDDLVWIQGAHDNYESLGVSSQVRTFAFAKPRAFLVIDHVQANGAHEYDQHFHLHPSLSDVSQRRSGTIVARAADQEGPSVTVTPVARPDRVRTLRGEESGEMTQGWYFPEFLAAEPSTDVVIGYERDGGELDFPVLVLVSAPGDEPLVPTQIDYAVTAGELRFTWTAAGVDRRVAIPAP